MNLRRIATQSALVLGAVLLSAGIQTFAFTDTNATPPSDDAYAPLTTSNVPEFKEAGLTVNRGGAPVGLVVNGAIKMGDGSTISSPAVGAGALRFNASTGNLEISDGTSWGRINAIFDVSGSMTWSTPGTYTWTVPAHVNTIKTVELRGGGGGGAWGSPDGTGYSGAGGGGGGYGTTINYAVTPGQTITVVVGAGGVGGTAGSGGCVQSWNKCCAGGTGGSSSFDGILISTGGQGGQSSLVEKGPCAGGAGGSASGPGVAAQSGVAGGAGKYCNGSNTGANGGSGANSGGAGGAGAPYSGAPTAGSVVGGAGGGGFCGGGSSGNIGAAGAAGRVTITW